MNMYVKVEIGKSKLEEFMHSVDSKADSGRINKTIINQEVTVHWL